MNMAKDKKIVVTGVGPIAAPGIGKNNFWHSILECKATVSTERTKNLGSKDKYYVHKVKKFNINDFGIEAAVLDDFLRNFGRDNYDIQYLLASAKLAIDDSALLQGVDSHDIGLILAHENPGHDRFIEKAFMACYRLMKSRKIKQGEFFKSLYGKFSKEVYNLQSFMWSFYISKIFGFHGPALFLNNACASGLYSIEMASLLIKSGQCKAVVIAAADRPDEYKYFWFKNQNLYSPEREIKPFASDSKGFIMGAGGGGIVLEDADNAKNRGAPIYAEYKGGGLLSESWKIALPAVGSNYYEQVIKKALDASRLKSDSIDWVVPHAVGSAISDLYESRALINVFGSRPTYSAFKPYVGHLLGASGIIETIILLLALKNQIIPATLNHFPNKHPKCLELNNKVMKQKITNVLKTSCAFAGNDAALIFGEFL